MVKQIQYRKNILALIMVLFVTVVVSAQVTDTIVSVTTTNRNILLEEYTGSTCVYCPDGHRMANELAAAYPGRVNVINIYDGPYTNNIYTTQFGSALSNQSDLTFYPSATINRHVFSGSITSLSRYDWADCANQIMAMPSPVNIAAEGTLDWTTRTVNIRVQLYYTADQTVTSNALNIAIIQDDVLGSQTGGSTYDPNQMVGDQYTHQHILRHLITGQWGETINTISQGTLVERIYEYEIPEQLGFPNPIAAFLENLRFIAFVCEGHQEVLTSIEIPVQHVNVPVVGGQIVSVIEIQDFECNEHGRAYFEFKNNGSDSVTSLTYTYLVNDAAIQNVVWNGIIPSMNKDTIHIPIFDLNLNTDNTVVVQVTAINGENVNLDSKSLTIKKIVYSGSGKMFFKLATDFYASETSFNIIDPNGDTVLSGGHWPNLTSYGTYVRAFNFFPQTVGCYRLEVYDTYGDGINSGYGAGYFQLLAEDGSQIFLNDGHFTHKVTYMIDVSAPATFDEDFNIVYVTPTGSGNHSGDSWTNATSSISFALIKAMAYHADVWVAAGIYYGDTASENAVTMVDGVNVYGGFLGNESEDYNLSLRDFVTNTSILDGQSTRQVLYQPFPFTSQTTWDGFTIQHGWSTYYYGGGVSLNQNGYLSHCIIKNNYASAGGGVYAGYNSTVSNCLVSNNTADGWGGGVLASGATISNSTIVRNSANSGAGIYGYSFSNLTNSIVWGNESDTSQDVMGYLSCSYSALEGGGEGEYNIFLSDEINQNPLFINPSLVAGISDTTVNVDWHLQDGSVCINHGNNMAVTDSVDLDGMVRILRDTVDLGCFESDYNSSPIIIPIVYVAENGFGSKTGESWENAMASIQDAIALAKTRIGIVWVAAGTYFGDTTAANAFNIIEGVNVYGGFVGNEPAEYDLSLRDFKANATILDGLNARRVLYQPSSFNTLTSWDGFTIQNGQTAGYYGSGGGAYLNGNGKLCHCIIKDNTAYYGGGVYAYNSEVSNCLISNNTANGDGGGVYAYYSSTSISNCLISNNTATSYGGGVYNYYATIANSTIVHNTANNGSGVYSSLGGNIINSVVWGNGTDENNNMSGTVACSYSAVEGGAENGEHVINLNSANSGSASEVYYPWFVSPDNGDFRLHHRSCLINAGTNLNNLPTTDLSNLSRVYDDTVDIGCYEFHGEAYCATPVSLTVQDVTGSAAMLTWENHDPDGSSLYELSYKMEDNDEWIVLDSMQTEHYLLTGLQPQTSYAARVRIICDVDSVSYYSAIKHFSNPCSSGTDVVSVGETTSNYNGGVIPVNISYPYSYTQQIYQAAEIGGAKLINSIFLQCLYGSQVTRNIDVYLGHTQKLEFSSNYDWISLEDLTLVYSGNLSFNSIDEDYWVEIPLNTFFDYNGVDDLVMVFCDNTGYSTYNDTRFYTHQTSGYSSMYAGWYGTDYNLANPNSGNRTAYRNNLRLSACIEDTCNRSVLTAVTNITDSTAQLLFTFENGISDFELEFKEESDDDYIALSPVDSIYILTGLRQNTRYEVRTRTVCDEGYSHWKRLLFTTGVINYDRLYVTQNGTGDGGSWTTATSDLQWALNTARKIRITYGTSPEVWVASGIYYGDTTAENAFTMVDGVDVYGGFAGNEPMDYDLSQRDLVTNITVLNGQNTQRSLYQPSSFTTLTTWDGFMILNGQTTGSGGGAYLKGKGQLSHCVIKNNTAYYGGGVYMDDNSTVSNCMFLNNNASSGGGIYAYNSNLSNCLISNNTATYGGGVYNYYATITNSTIVRNLANNGAGVYGDYWGNLTNSIVWGNGTDELNNIVGNVTCSYSAVEGGFAGDGNILLSDYLQQTPQFVHPSLISGASDNTSDVDWHLQQGSVCVNKGNNAVVTDSLDLDGTLRVKLDTVDMGCYESDFYSSPTIDLNYSNIVYVTQNGSGSRTGEDWDNATSSLSFALSVARTYNADVWVATGTYYGDTTFDNAFTMVEGVNVFGGFAGNEPADYDLSQRNFETNITVLDGQNAQRVLYQPSSFNILTSWDGFTIQNGQSVGYYGYGGGAYLNGKGKLCHCVIKNNTAYNGGGVYAYNGLVSNCLISNNIANGDGGGVNAIYATVSNCEITHNTAYYGGGVYAYYSSTKVSNCLVSNNTANYSGGGVYSYYAIITNSTIVRNMANNGAGIYGSYQGNLTNSIVWGNGTKELNNITGSVTCSYSAVEGGFAGEQNILLSDYLQQTPLFVHPSLTPGASDNTSNVDWHLQQGSVCVNRGNNAVVTDGLDLDGTTRVRLDTVDIGCYESDFFSGPILELNYSNIIYVTQNGSGSRTGEDWDNATSSLYFAMVVARTFNANVWVATGTYYGDTTSENAFTMVEGVSAFGGFAGDEPADYDLSQRNFETNITVLDGQNARRVLYQTSSFNTLTTWDGFTIQNGYTSGSGGGVYLNGNGILCHCVINNNGAYYGGGVYAYNGVISNCLISNNTANGNGGGVNASYATVSNCEITHNTAYSGGGVYAYYSSTSISNCLISNNTATYGGGAYNYYATITNSTIVRNLANNGAGVYGDYWGNLTNSIVWGNGTDELNNIVGNVTCSYSAVEGGFAGDGNILLSDYLQQTPQFVYPSLTSGVSDNTSNVDWHMQQGSVCVNRGNNAVVTDSLDLDGTMRVKFDTVDMGCYESDFFSTPVLDLNYSNIIYVTQNGSGSRTGEDWDNATSSITFALAVARVYNAEVWVAAGTYYGDTTSENAFNMVEGVNVYGGFVGDESANYDLSQRDLVTNITILDGQNARRVLYQPSSFNILTTWDGFTIQNGKAPYHYDLENGGGAYLLGKSILKNCIFQNNYARGGGGIYANSAAIINCLVCNNTCLYAGGGIMAYYGTSVYRCTIINNYGGTIGGIYSYSYSNNKSVISNCVIANNTGCGCWTRYGLCMNSTIVNNSSPSYAGVTGNNSEIINCIIWGNKTNQVAYNLNMAENVSISYSAIEGGYSGDSIITLSAENPPLFVNPSLTVGADDSTANVDWHLQQGSPCINAGDNSAVTDSLDLDGNPRVKEGRVDMGCYEYALDSVPITEYDSIIYVTVTGAGTHSGNSWANAISSIDTAQILAQGHNAVVWVAAGTYYGDTTSTAENAFTMRDGVSVYGGFAGNEPADYDLSLRDFETNETVLDGQDVRRILLQPNGFGTKAKWNGFTLRNGRISGSGGGAYLMSNGELNKCKITACTAGSGGGVYSSGGSITECTITNCTAGNGGGVNCTGNTTVSSSTISSNTATSSGGGVYSYNSSLFDCDITGNETSGSGGGVYCYSYVTYLYLIDVLPTNMVRCRISGNHSVNNGGGVCFGYGNDKIKSCLVSNNTSNTTGGGVHGNGYVYNTTIVRNSSVGAGAGVYKNSYNGYMTLYNCIVWGNESNGVQSNVVGSVVKYSAIEGGYIGTGNIMLDGINQPYFVNPSLTAGYTDSTANADWHLQQGSVCINRGNNSMVVDDLDLDGITRIKRDTIDLGCYESDYYSVPMTEYDSIIYVTVTGAGTHSGNSWENATSSIADAQAMARMYNAVVWVAAGTYYGDTTSTSNNAFTMVDGVNVYGGFAGNEPADYDLSLRDFEVNETVLDGQDVRRILLQPNGFGTKAKWNGFTLRNGRISGSGGGAYLLNNGELNQCKIIACMAGSGGGVYSSGGSVTECTITNCTAGNGGGVNCTGNSTVSSCSISDNTATSSGGGVYSYGSNIVDCDIIRNDASNYGGGIYCYYFAGLYFDVNPTNMLRCRISGNYSGNNGGGVCMGYGNDKLKSCLISNNTSNTTGGGVHGNGSLYNTTVVRNSSVSNGAGVVGLSNGYGTSLSNCIVWGNEASGVRSNVTGSVVNYSAIEGGYGGTDNIMLSDTNQPFFVAPSLTAGYSDSTENVDWHLQQSSPCINRGNDAAVVDELDLDGTARIKRDTVDMGCYESDYYSVPVIEYDSIIYVTVTGAGTHSGDSWENAISSLSEAQALAKTYDAVVWVAAGTYYGDTTSTSNAFSMVDRVCVYGGFVGNEPANYDLSLRDLETNETVLDGQNERRVLLQPSGYGTRTIWDGFTLRNGHTSGYGGGAYLRNNGVLNQCEVKDCAAGSGGGVYSIGGSVTECAITNCTAGNGGGVNCTGNTTISSSIIADNIATSSGGGLYSYNSTFIDCDITGNEASGYGGGVYCYYFASVISYEVAPTNLIRCRISRNHSANSGGGICMGYGNDKAKDCLISNNTSNTTGGGVSGNGSLLNTTVVHNQSTGNGAGVNGGFSLLNSIVWGNRRLGLKDNLYGGISCSYSAIEGGYVGEGNVTLESSNMGIGASPCFVSPTFGAGIAYDNGDWHLSQNSACVNVGSLDSTLLSETDLDGNPRMQYGRVDMGCYEFQNTQIVDSVNVIVLSDNVMRGSAVGGGLYNTGDTVLLRAVPSQYAQFLRWSDNDTTNPRYVIAERDTTFVAIFDLYLPELHVTSISHSELVGGESATISWTVQNDGTASTPNGAVWYDRIWLSLEPKVSSSGVIPTLLGTFPNVSALAPGESYTQTETVELPTQITGDYYLFVTTDAYSADPIYWENGVEVPYNPPAYLAALSYGCNGYDCGNYAGNRIFEISEYDHYSNYPYYHDNFFYVQTEVTVPKYPDLRVMYISPMPQNSFSGQPLNISFHVSNEGDYDTRVPYWTDVVFASNHDVFDQAAIPIKTISHHGLLMKDSSYVVNTIINLPMTMEGQVWLFVHTDYYNQVNEHVGILNNVTRSDSINVILVPPADLVPQNILADNMVSTGANFHFSYEIHNQGAGEPDHNLWVDRCYLSADTNDLANAIQIAGDNHFNGLSVNGFYPISHTMVLPSSVTEGTYYLYVHADAENNVFEYTLDDNNIVRFDQPITVVQPDLQMLTLNVEDTLHAGAEASVSYILANTGNGAVINQNVTDGFFLSQMPDGVNAIELPSFTYNSWLDAHDSVLKYQNVMLPGDLQDGVYFLFARTNVNNMVNEANTNNNRSPIRKVYVNHQQLPDLVVTSVSLPDTISVGFPVTFTANLTNQGETAAALNNLAFRLSAVTDSNSINCSVVNVTADTQSLAVGSVTTVTLIAIVSPAVVSNPASFVLTVNPNHSISESNYSNNGFSFSQTLQLYPFDLMASQLSSPNASISGQYISVSWHVDNIGTVPSETQPMFMRQDMTYLLVNDEHLPLPWFDKVYLSQDSLFDDSDVLIGDRARQNIVYAGDGYSAGINCLIPVASDGNYYVIVVSDATNVTFDSQRANNVVARPISIIQSPLPDLQMDSLVVTNSLTTGVTYQIQYSVSNNGEHITHGDRWTDALYLNYQPTLEDAVLLGSKIHYGQLDVNAQYTATLSVNIPNIWVGEAYLMGYTDVTDQIVEMNSESNNLFVLPVSISRPLSSDLTVFAPDFPQSAMVGEDIQVSWSLQNIGLNTAQGLIKDAVYLSTDSTWSNDDILLGTVQYDINLAPSSQQQQIDTLTLQGVPIGDYYVVVRTNILNALNEDSYTNNKAVSLMTMHVDYPSLYIDQEEQLQLNSGQSVYYKLEVGPMYEHQTLSCKLSTQSTNVANKLYIAYSSAPSASNFDWSATLPYEHNQEILIPSLEQGVYYIMASGQTSDNSSQSASLLASIVHFEILSIYPYEGENIGSVTAKVIGAQFDTVMDFRLVNNNYYLPAEKVIFSNSTESYVTFNLLNQSLGDYDLEAELPGGVITVKEHAFRVVPPSSNVPTALQSMFVCVDMVRVGSLFTVDVEYKNEGTTDLNVLGFVVSSNGFPITDGSGEWSDTELYLEAEEGEVIPPGHYATKTIIVWAIQTGDIVLKLYPVRRRY